MVYSKSFFKNFNCITKALYITILLILYSFYNIWIDFDNFLCGNHNLILIKIRLSNI